MQFSNLSTQYSQLNSDVIASITKENTNSANSNISSVYESAHLNLDAAVLSISSKGTAKMNAMLSKSIQLKANVADPKLSAEDRREVSNELRELRREMEEIRSADTVKPNKKPVSAETTNTKAMTEDKEETIDADTMMSQSTENIIKNANESIQSHTLNNGRVLQFL